MDRLKTLFQGFASVDVPPVAFVLIGDFSSKPVLLNGHDTEYYTGNHRLALCARLTAYGAIENFNALADILAAHPQLMSCSHFVIVPGPHDPYCTPDGAAPRPPLLPALLGRMRTVVTRLHLATNPCRLRYATQEIVVYRDPLVCHACDTTPSFDHPRPTRPFLCTNTWRVPLWRNPRCLRCQFVRARSSGTETTVCGCTRCRM